MVFYYGRGDYRGYVDGEFKGDGTGCGDGWGFANGDSFGDGIGCGEGNGDGEGRGYGWRGGDGDGIGCGGRNGNGWGTGLGDPYLELIPYVSEQAVSIRRASLLKKTIHALRHNVKQYEIFIKKCEELENELSSKT